MTARAHEKDYSKTWMLFESGNSATVDLSLYSSPSGKARPIDAYIVTECEGDFTSSARRAAEAVYGILGKNYSSLHPLVVGYDLQGLPAGRPVSGESGGLAFAIALAKRLIEHDPGPVAATGEVKGSHGGGPVGAVKGLTSKITTAARLIPAGGWVLYPKDNDAAISEELRSSLTEKGIKLRAVSSVADAISLLFELPNPGSEVEIQSRKSRWPFLLVTLMMVLLTIGVFAFMRANNWPPFSADTLPALEEKNHAHISAALKKGEPAGHKNAIDQPTSTTPKGNSITKLEIDFPGSTLLASKLGQLTHERVTSFLKNGTVNSPGYARVGGRVVILNISEDPVNHAGEIRSEMTVALKGLSHDNGKDIRTFPELTVNISGKGPVHSLLPQVASALTEETIKALVKEGHVTRLWPAQPSDAGDEKEKKKRSKVNSGFE
jgi:hypothetical protein